MKTLSHLKKGQFCIRSYGAMLFAIVIACACNRGSKGTDVLSSGGHTVLASDNITRSTVALTLDLNPKSFGKTGHCSGSFVAPNLIVTAAHCVMEKDICNGYVTWGTEVYDPSRARGLFKKTNPEASATRIKRVVFHRGYLETVEKDDRFDQEIREKEGDEKLQATENSYNASFEIDAKEADLALVEFAGTPPAPREKGQSPYAPVRVASKKQTLNLPPEGTLIAAGFGVSDPSGMGDEGAGILRAVALKFFAFRGKQTEIEMRSPPPRSILHGDSGGPLFIEKNGELTLVGVAARGNPEVTSGQWAVEKIGYLNIFTDLRAYYGWIEKNGGVDLATGSRTKPILENAVLQCP